MPENGFDEQLRLCCLCQNIPHKSLSMEVNGYAHVSSVAELRDSAAGEDYCMLCQMLWESVVTKQARLRPKSSVLDPLLSQSWQVRIYGFLADPVPSNEKDLASESFFRGYEALELRCGDRGEGESEAESDSTWWSVVNPSTSRREVYPVVSRLYLRLIDELGCRKWIYTILPLDDGSSVVTKTIQTWHEQCLNLHGHPSRSHDETMPGRLIDLQDSGGQLRLIENPLAGLRYAALSYCWGITKGLTTTAENCRRHIESGFSLEDLPATLRDAATLSRKLGLCYLWIDALCITQGKTEEAKADWEKECVKMASIYGNAALTIVAANGNDSNEGFIKRRRPDPESQRQVYDGISRQSPLISRFRNTLTEGKTLSKRHKWGEGIGYEGQKYEWSFRGWTLQEIFLSTNAIIFSKENLYWKCERGLCGINTRKTSIEGVSLGVQVPSNAQELELCSKMDVLALPGQWRSVVEEYSRRYLTVPQDKLPALSGMAQKFSESSTDNYLAGLWRSSLLTDLLWRSVPVVANLPRRTSDWRAPSWSWASIDGAVDYDMAIVNFKQTLGDAEVLEADTVVAGADAFGRISKSSLKIRGRLKQATSLRLEPNLSAGDIFDGDLKIARAWSDEKGKLEEEEQILRPWCFLVKQGAGLLLESVDHRPRVFKRIGLITLKSFDLGRILPSWKVEEIEII